MQQDFNSKDGQFGYIKDLAANVWRKVRLADGVVVSSVTVPPSRKAAGKDAYKAHHQQTYQSSASYPKVPHVWESKPLFEVKDHYYFNGCGHDGTKRVWGFMGKEFYCAGAGQIDPSKFDLVLDLADQVDAPRWTFHHGNVIVGGSPASYNALNAFIVEEGVRKVPKPVELPHKNVVHFHWRDGEGLPVDTEFWEKLWELLPGTQKVPAKILISCMGSHGRTGTCLAALMLTSGDQSMWSPQVAVLSVRSKHCELAVENRCQLKYLNALADEWGLPQDALEADRYAVGKSPAALGALRETEGTHGD